VGKKEGEGMVNWIKVIERWEDIVAKSVNERMKWKGIPIRVIKKGRGMIWEEKKGEILGKRYYRYLGTKMTWADIKKFNNEKFKFWLGVSKVNWEVEKNFWKLHGIEMKGKWIPPVYAKKIAAWSRLLEKLKKLKRKHKKVERQVKELKKKIKERAEKIGGIGKVEKKDIEKRKQEIVEEIKKCVNGKVKYEEGVWKIKGEIEKKTLWVKDIKKAGVEIEDKEKLKELVKKWNKLIEVERLRYKALMIEGSWNEEMEKELRKIKEKLREVNRMRVEIK